MKKKKRKAAGLLLAMAAAGSLLSGSALAEEGEEPSEGLVSWMVVQAYNDACSINGGTKDLWEHEIEGEKPGEWMRKKAADYVREYLAVQQKFEESGMSLRAEELETVESTVETYWSQLGYGRYYEDYGVTREDFAAVLAGSRKYEILFGEEKSGLESQVTDEDVVSYIRENANLLEYVAVPCSTVLGDDATEEEIAAWVDTDAIYEEYKKRLEDGESLEALIKEVSEDESRQSLGISSSCVGGLSEALFLNDSTALSNGFREELADAPYNEIIYFDDTAQMYRIIFMKKEFTEDWEGLNSYRDEIVELIAAQRFSRQTEDWGKEFEYDGEEIPSAKEIEEMLRK